MVTPPLETIIVLITAVTGTGTGLIEAIEMAEADEVREVVAVRGTGGKGTEVIVTEEIVGTEKGEIEVTGVTEVTDTANVPGRLVVIAHPGVPGATSITIVRREQSDIGSVSLTGSLVIWT